ncbi:MAG: DUF2283 domain-containing protein [Alkalinema sp. RU_4_3]|nr:DUF2283 domain-containing protein [Alkalinema sp. RU_4_3]
MKILYDPDKDILQISFKDEVIEETAQIAPGLILDYDVDGHVLGIELTDASKRVDSPTTITYLVGAANQDKPQPLLKGDA